MNDQPTERKSRLIGALREGISVVQMVLYKQIKALLTSHAPERDASTTAKLAAALTNELFGTPNPDPIFVQFREQHQAFIEQELAGLAEHLPQIKGYLTDALRVQVICDDQQGIDDHGVLQTADSLGLLLKERNIPLPSAFMTLARGLGEQHGLIIAPVPISTEDDQSLVH